MFTDVYDTIALCLPKMLRVTSLNILAFFIPFIYNISSFNLEELKHINYEVDISFTPVIKEEIKHPAMYITSRSGREFLCQLPPFHKENISEKGENEKYTDVVKLLKPLKEGPCLYKIKDWWIYEFCFEHYIKQFHIEEGKIVGPIINLGIYGSDYDWNNETYKEKFKGGKQRYHSQFYISGTNCDLTGQPRNTEVRFYCEEDGGDYIYGVDEPGTCSYIINVHTSRLCSHPLLKPLPLDKTRFIACQPVLNEEQYSKYLKDLKGR